MVVRLRFRHWLFKITKLFAVGYGFVLMMTYIAPTIQLDRALEERLFTVFVNHAPLWVKGIPVAFVTTNLGWFLLQMVRQTWVNYKIDKQGVVRLVLPRVDAKTTMADAVQFWNQVSDLIPKYQHITFEMAGSSHRVNFALAADAGANRALIMQAMADWPGTQSAPVDTAEDDPLFVAEGQSAVQIVLRPKQSRRPIQTAVTDVLAAPLVEIARLPEGVKGGVLVLVRGDDQTKKRLGSIAAKETAQKTTGKSLAQKRSISTLR